MLWVYDSILVISAFLFAFAGTGVAYGLLSRGGVMDMPNARSNHSRPTPRGGGLALMFSVLCFMLVAGTPTHLWWGLLLLTLLSFWDDVRSLPARYRLLAQIIVVAWMVLSAAEIRIFTAFLPHGLELLLVGLAWIWFINLFNFMDGADGLAASEAIAIAAGILVLSALVPIPATITVLAMIVTAATFGFLLWNWPPARIFMGDSGSIPLGLLLGYMVIQLATAGYMPAALILPAIFVSDATTTLLRRLVRRERIFEAHSTHAYQRAIRSGLSHRTVALRVTIFNVLLIGLAVASACDTAPYWSWFYVAVAYGLTALLLVHFSSQQAQSIASAASGNPLPTHSNP